MRSAIIIPALLLAGCGSGPAWENQQEALANEVNTTEAAAEISAEHSNVIATDTDYINETAPSANNVNATAPAANETSPQPDG